MKSKLPYYLLLHFVILIFGFTGILGKFITISADELVWHRMSIAAIVLFLFLIFRRQKIKVDLRTFWKLVGTGAIIAAHWVTFFGAIKVSNVSVTLVCLSSAALFTALLRPLLSKEKFIPYEALLGITVIGGIMLIFAFESQYALGISLAVISASLAGLFTVLNANFLKDSSSPVIAFYEMLGGAAVLTVYLLVTSSLTLETLQMALPDFYAILILAVVCTAFAFVAGLWVMRKLSPFTVSLSVNMEPIYAIIMAYFLWNESETMSPQFYLGAVLILSTLFTNAWLKKRAIRRKLNSPG